MIVGERDVYAVLAYTFSREGVREARERGRIDVGRSREREETRMDAAV